MLHRDPEERLSVLEAQLAALRDEQAVLVRRVVDEPLRIPEPIRVVADLVRVAALLAGRAVPFPLRQLEVLLTLGERVESLGGQPKRSGDVEVSVELGGSAEKRLAFGSAPGVRLRK